MGFTLVLNFNVTNVIIKLTFKEISFNTSKPSTKFKCDRCYYHAFNRNNLIQHKKDKHENLGYLKVNLLHTKIVFIPNDT